MKLEQMMEREKRNFLRTDIAKEWILLVTGLTLLYFFVIAFMFPTGNRALFYLLIAGEIFHVWQVLAYAYTVWRTEHHPFKDDSYEPGVDIFVTVAGEPTDIVEETILAAKAIDYPRKNIYILNDGFVAKKDNWQEMEGLAKRLSVHCITRRIPGGAKAGNINNALRETGSHLVVIFDADHVPHADFLKKTVPYFADDKMAFVQSPQFYKNFQKNFVTQGSWEQQQLFFGPICKGKNRLNAATMCGTNMVIRRDMLVEVGGMSEESIAEDFLTGIKLHQKGWKSVYVPEVLAEGLAPEDFLSYFKQQFRWARGAFDVLSWNFFFGKGMTLAQKIQYFSSVSFYFSGLVVLMNALIPIVYFYTGQVPFIISTMLLATVFLPYLFVTLYMIQRTSGFTFTFKALSFSMGGFSIHIKALWAAVTRQKSSFQITPKKQQEGNFIKLVIPHLAYFAVALVGMGVAILREGFSPSFMVNTAWFLLNAAIFAPFIYAALPMAAKERSAADKARVAKADLAKAI